MVGNAKKWPPTLETNQLEQPGQFVQWNGIRSFPISRTDFIMSCPIFSLFMAQQDVELSIHFRKLQSSLAIVLSSRKLAWFPAGKMQYGAIEDCQHWWLWIRWLLDTHTEGLCQPGEKYAGVWSLTLNRWPWRRSANTAIQLLFGVHNDCATMCLNPCNGLQNGAPTPKCIHGYFPPKNWCTQYFQKKVHEGTLLSFLFLPNVRLLTECDVEVVVFCKRELTDIEFWAFSSSLNYRINKILAW